MLTAEQISYIDRLQEERLELFRHVPKDGVLIEYLGKKFIVYKNVFWPCYDSTVLVDNYKINPGELVLDVCTGSGVLAVMSAYNGASKVVALDVNPDSVRCAKKNASLHGFSDKIDVRLSDMFSALDDEQFDVITGNLPFRNKIASSLPELSMWDTDLQVHRKFFSRAGKYLTQEGRVYLLQSNFGAVDEMKHMADEAGFSVNLIGERNMPRPYPRIFYAFELRRK